MQGVCPSAKEALEQKGEVVLNKDMCVWAGRRFRVG